MFAIPIYSYVCMIMNPHNRLIITSGWYALMLVLHGKVRHMYTAGVSAAHDQ